MRNLPSSGTRGKPWSAARRFRGWLASWLQDRRRGHLLPAPLLVATWPSLATWAWTYANPERWNAYNSLDGGLTYQFDDWVVGSGRQYAPDGGQHLMFIVGVDASGVEITHRSNAVRPDDAIAPPNVPLSLIAVDGLGYVCVDLMRKPDGSFVAIELNLSGVTTWWTEQAALVRTRFADAVLALVQTL